ncbi:hypothetical protein NQ314_012707 [Rhamnusium bicolor]|uniref:Uncharacterized protein n=1 Tax=Rhamnusium bicolor TaxID=1586634 RepID=A0AAV8X9V0_9CUCU|nr:hypothetical protein NQ314_012707 [Rhamnusium bicolor]
MDRLERIDLNILSDASSDSEEEPPRIVRNGIMRNNLYEQLNDTEFRKRFRISKNTFQRLANLLDGVMEPVNDRNQPISKINQILMSLFLCFGILSNQSR